MSQTLTEVTYSLATGGSERVAATIARAAVDRGIATTVCATHGPGGLLEDKLMQDGIPCFVAGGGRIKRMIRLYRHFRTVGTTVAHVHHFNMLASAYRPARLAGVSKIVVTEHSSHLLRTRSVDRWRARRFARRVDHVTAVHDGLADYLMDEIHLPSERVSVIPNGVDVRAFRPRHERAARDELGIAQDDVVVGMVGRLHPDKDPMNLVHAFRLLRERNGGAVRLMLIGDGPLRPDIEEYLRNTGLNTYVELLGDRSDVADLLSSLDVFVLPSRTEGHPVALLEAMSAGLAIIATKVGGVGRAIGDAGILVPAEDPGALADAIGGLINDPQRRLGLGQRARARAVQEHSLPRMLDAYFEVLGLD